MHGSLCLHRGLLYVGLHAKTAMVRGYDLDGRLRVGGFRFRDARLGRSVVAGLAVDDDRHVWVADTPSSRVREFTLFGREVGGLGLDPAAPLDGDGLAGERAGIGRDEIGLVRAPVAVAVRGDVDGMELLVGSGGIRRHAVQLFDEAGSLVESLRPLGDRHGRFEDVRGLAMRGSFVWVAEARAGRVQVFRDRDFHFAFHVPRRAPFDFEPIAVAPLEDGRVVVACRGAGSALLLCDRAGRLERVLAEHGADEGEVFEPSDVVVDDGDSDRTTRIAVIDRDGERIQVFAADGRCFGAFGDLGTDLAV